MATTKSISQLNEIGSLDTDALVEVAQLSETVTITATTISADGDDNSFNDSGSGFVAAGFEVGNRVKVVGFTGNVANNIFAAFVTALTTGKMTIGGVDGDVIVDDAAGESVTITKWESFRTTVADLVASSGATVITVDDEGAEEAAQLASLNFVGPMTVAESDGSGNVTVTFSHPAVATDADNYTLSPADNGKYIRLTAAGAKTIDIALEATTALPDNGEWHFRNVGAGNATVTPVGGVTVNVPTSGTLVVPQGGTITLKRVADDEFDLFGVTETA